MKFHYHSAVLAVAGLGMSDLECERYSKLMLQSLEQMLWPLSHLVPPTRLEFHLDLESLHRPLARYIYS
jgi:hypothetical protein